MPITDSAKKAFRQNVRRRARNASAKKTLNETVKKYRKLAGTDKTAATQFLSDLYQKLDKAAKNNLIRPNKAARLKSRLSKKLRSAKTT